MESGHQPLNVIVAITASEELEEIWRYNARQYGRAHANAYEAFLLENIYSLAEKHNEGKSVEVRPELRQITFKQGRRGHGHTVIYRVTDKSVVILHVYHTAQDIE